jgi:acyl-CoA synthetase (AMP-forming)/AMP-acid ligase II
MTDVRRISDALKVRAVHQRDEIAHDDTIRQITYAQWDREADEVGGGLAAAGLQPGDRVSCRSAIFMRLDGNRRICRLPRRGHRVPDQHTAEPA